MFLLGVECPIVESAICPPMPQGCSSMAKTSTVSPTSLFNGVRAPSPRVCFGEESIGYLYDRMTGIGKFHILIFASDLQGPVREPIMRLSESFSSSYDRFGGAERFNVLLVVKALPHETEALLAGPEFEKLREVATIVSDDRAPDDDAHYQYGINHTRGAVVVVRPDLMVGITAWPEDMEAVEKYLAGFLNPVETLLLNDHVESKVNGHSEDTTVEHIETLLNGHSEKAGFLNPVETLIDGPETLLNVQ